MPSSFVAGAVTGAIAGEVGKEAFDDVVDTVTGQPQLDRHLLHLTHQTSLLDRIAQAVERAISDARPPTHTEIVTFTKVNHYDVLSLGRDHISLFAAVGFPLLVRTTVGDTLRQMQPGWNALDPPDGSSLLIDASGTLTSVNVFLRWSDESLDIPYTGGGSYGP